MSYREAYTADEWQTLQFSPIWVFNAVASSNKKVTDKEVKALLKEIADAPLYKQPLVREVLMSIALDFARIMDEYKYDSRDVASGLKETSLVLSQKATPNEAVDFKKALMLIGGNIARASGGGLFRKDAMSKAEKTALVMVALWLSVSP